MRSTVTVLNHSSSLSAPGWVSVGKRVSAAAASNTTVIAIVDEQAATLIRTAFTPVVAEAEDLAAGVFDARGRMLAQSLTGTPGDVAAVITLTTDFGVRDSYVAEMAEFLSTPAAPTNTAAGALASLRLAESIRAAALVGAA